MMKDMILSQEFQEFIWNLMEKAKYLNTDNKMRKYKKEIKI